MKRKHRDVPFKVKDIEKSGEFSGYLSVFDEVDWYSDVVKPGAFAKTLGRWASKGKLPPVLWQHKSDEPIGPFTLMREDDTGLYVEGRLLIDEKDANPEARKAYGLLKANVIDGMSIGYDTLDAEYDPKGGVVNLLEVDLWEGSICTFQAGPSAVVQQVKSLLRDGTLPSLAAFEDFLRDVGGLSKKQALIITGHGYKALLRSDSEGDRSESDAEAVKALEPLKLFLEGKSL